MKKSTLSAIYEVLKSIDFDPEMLADVEKDLTRGDAERVKNAEMYDQAKPIVFEVLANATDPVTISELYDEVANSLPEGMTKGKMQYAVTRLWIGELVKTEGKVNTYSLKA